MKSMFHNMKVLWLKIFVNEILSLEVKILLIHLKIVLFDSTWPSLGIIPETRRHKLKNKFKIVDYEELRARVIIFWLR